MSVSPFRSSIDAALASGDGLSAIRIGHQWIDSWLASLPLSPDRVHLCKPELWSGLAEIAERTADHSLLERFWQILDGMPPPDDPECGERLALLGIPIVNRVDLLGTLLESIDFPVHHLAIIDNSILPGGDAYADLQGQQVYDYLIALQQLGHPFIEHIHIARPFRNLGVAASWNLILTSFPEVTHALIANNDICFSPGALRRVWERMDPRYPQFLPMFPDPNGFSAFLITSLCWDHVGLFDYSFSPAYFEDLEFRDCLNCDPMIEVVKDPVLHGEMETINAFHSATINSDPVLHSLNEVSYALNKLWYLSSRRLRNDRRGLWRRLWLSQWRR